MKREESQGRKSNSIDYQPNHCLHHNVTFFFFLVTCRLSKVLLCQQVFSHSDIPFLEYLTWIPMATQVRLWTFVTIDWLCPSHFTLSWIPDLVGNKFPVKIISNWFVIFFSCLYSLYVTMIMVVCEKRKNENTNLISFKFFYVYAHVYAKVGSFSEESGKKRWCGPAKITIKNT